MPQRKVDASKPAEINHRHSVFARYNFSAFEIYTTLTTKLWYNTRIRSVTEASGVQLEVAVEK